MAALPAATTHTDLRFLRGLTSGTGSAGAEGIVTYCGTGVSTATGTGAKERVLVPISECVAKIG